MKVARLHHHIANVLQGLHFKLAHPLCRKAGIIFVGDLNRQELARGCSARTASMLRSGNF